MHIYCLPVQAANQRGRRRRRWKICREYYVVLFFTWKIKVIASLSIISHFVLSSMTHLYVKIQVINLNVTDLMPLSRPLMLWSPYRNSLLVKVYKSIYSNRKISIIFVLELLMHRLNKNTFYQLLIINLKSACLISLACKATFWIVCIYLYF